MTRERGDVFGKRDATIGVLAVVVATLLVAVVGVGLAALMLLVF